MGSITVRKVGEVLKSRLRQRAAKNGRSMAEEVSQILKEALEEDFVPERGLGTAIHELFKPYGGVDLGCHLVSQRVNHRIWIKCLESGE